MVFLRKTVVLGIGILVILWVLWSGGCMITEKDYLRGAERYLKKKYGEEFEGQYGYYGAGYTLILNPKSNPEWQVAVRYEKKNGRVIFHDNYVAFQLKPEIEQMIKDLAYPIYGECKVYLIPWVLELEDDWNKESSLPEYLRLRAFGIELFTDADSKDKEEQLQRFLDACLQEDLKLSRLNLYYMTKEGFENTRERSIDYINSKSLYIVRGVTNYIEKDGIEGYGETDWLEGRGEDE